MKKGYEGYTRYSNMDPSWIFSLLHQLFRAIYTERGLLGELIKITSSDFDMRY